MIRPMRRGPLSICVVAVLLTLSGCADSVSETYHETGIDELEIPTPSPDPDDFVAVVDNPWLPLEPGSTWIYEFESTAGVGETTVTVEPSNLRLAGVAVTVVRTLSHIGRGMPTETTDYYAQDRDGNVWWFGRAGVWDVEVAGAEAGLAMPAEPRVGDGWRQALLDGVVEDRATVESVDDGQVILRVESDLAPGVVVQRSYEKGTGLVRTFNLAGPPGSSELVPGA
jgi:hypothetical protein